MSVKILWMLHKASGEIGWDLGTRQGRIQGRVQAVRSGVRKDAGGQDGKQGKVMGMRKNDIQGRTPKRVGDGFKVVAVGESGRFQGVVQGKDLFIPGSPEVESTGPRIHGAGKLHLSPTTMVRLSNIVSLTLPAPFFPYLSQCLLASLRSLAVSRERIPRGSGTMYCFRS